ncbi:MAG: class I SAM-dependent methyltransferase [Crocinitomicaceae bacterium]|nr:class I SAM-dependent methyltransferase [Crocinitomicaceae bacterium]
MNTQEINKYFFPERLDKYNYNYFIPRTAVSEFLKAHVDAFNGNVLDLACGHMPYRTMISENAKVDNYIPMDIASEEIYQNSDEIKQWDGKTIPLDDNSVDVILITEFLEHISSPSEVLIEIKRVLKPQGQVVGTVPFIWPMHETPHDHSRFTSFGLKNHLENSGFSEIQIESLGGANKAFALSIAIWLQQTSGVISKFTRGYWLKKMRKLIKTDVKSDVFSEGSIFTGLGFMAKK